MTPARVIIVEDHTMMRELFARLVRDQLGLEIVADCATVAEGASAILREKPDLTIVDWTLPDGTGADLVRQVKAKLPRLCWLFVSASEEGLPVSTALNLGVQGFVHKRSELDIFSKAVALLLAGKNYYCPVSAPRAIDRRIEETRAVELTPREREILCGIALGVNNKVLAGQLGVSPKTVLNHIATLKDKLGLFETAHLVYYAMEREYIEVPKKRM